MENLAVADFIFYFQKSILNEYLEDGSVQEALTSIKELNPQQSK